MKKIFSLVMVIALIMVISLSPATTVSAANKTSWKKAIVELSKKREGYIIYLDNNNIPEVLVNADPSYPQNVGVYAKLGTDVIYKYDKNKGKYRRYIKLQYSNGGCSLEYRFIPRKNIVACCNGCTPFSSHWHTYKLNSSKYGYALNRNGKAPKDLGPTEDKDFAELISTRAGDSKFQPLSEFIDEMNNK